MKTNYNEFYRKYRGVRTWLGRWRMHTYRSHPEEGYTRHWHLYGRDAGGAGSRA